MKMEINIPKSLDKKILKEHKEKLKKDGTDITCPTCDKKVTVKNPKPRCKYCGTTLELNF